MGASTNVVYVGPPLVIRELSSHFSRRLFIRPVFYIMPLDSDVITNFDMVLINTIVKIS